MSLLKQLKIQIRSKQKEPLKRYSMPKIQNTSNKQKIYHLKNLNFHQPKQQLKTSLNSLTSIKISLKYKDKNTKRKQTIQLKTQNSQFQQNKYQNRRESFDTNRFSNLFQVNSISHQYKTQRSDQFQKIRQKKQNSQARKSISLVKQQKAAMTNPQQISQQANQPQKQQTLQLPFLSPKFFSQKPLPTLSNSPNNKTQSLLLMSKYYQALRNFNYSQLTNQVGKRSIKKANALIQQKRQEMSVEVYKINGRGITSLRQLFKNKTQ